MPAVTYIDEALKQVLAGDAEIALLVGSRIYQRQGPQGTTYPLIVFDMNTQSRDEFNDLRGSSGMTRARYTVACISDSLEEVRNLARAVRNRLDYRSEHPIRLCVVKDEDEQQEPNASGDQLPVHRTDLSVEITYTAT
jgi:hypothetical protein